MAYLLGTESCIDSLRNDLADIQDTINEITTRSNQPTRCYSWKSPDKLATDLAIPDLLDRLQFNSQDDVDSQVAHYSLLELIIDRLLLLVHLSGNCIDESMELASSRKGSNSKVTHVSAGLAIKKYWNKLTYVISTVRHLKSMEKQHVDENSVNQISAKVGFYLIFFIIEKNGKVRP